MGHRHGPEALLAGIRPTQCIMIHHDYDYSNHILDRIICYHIVMVTSHSTVPYYLALAIQLSGKLLRIVDTIICGVSLHWHSCTDGLPLKFELGHDGILWCG